MSAICGIYKYENKINGKIYIGQSKDIKARIRGHRFSANHLEDKDAEMPIHKTLRKYGEENFNIEILEECNKKVLDEREKYWIEYYQSYDKGYNATRGGDSTEHFGKPVELYDFKGNFVTTYPSVTIAAEQLGVSRVTIYQILQCERLSCKGYQFKYQGDPRQITIYKNRQGGKIPILQYSKDGLFIKEWESAAAAARELCLDSSTITKVLKGKLKSTGNYRWYYKKDVMQG